MRFLIVDHYYPAFVQSIYGQDSALEARSHAEQRRRIDEALFGETVFEVAALRSLGHEASDALVNVHQLQAAWLREHRGARPSGWSLGPLRQFLFPEAGRSNPRWMGEALLAQVRTLRPDVVHIQCIDLLEAPLVKELRHYAKLVVGQIAAPLGDDRVLAAYDLVVSSLPNFVSRFRAQGVDAEWLPLAFDPSLVGRIGRHVRDVPLSFVGSLSTHHGARLALLESVAAVTGISVWTGDLAIARESGLLRNVNGPAWGRQMYEVMARSKLTLNSHIDVAQGFANNLRLFEATGMGAMLLTDEGSNLADLFVVGTEVVTYRSAADCAEKVLHFASHPDEASAIAAAGQARTLRDHTWNDRVMRLVGLIEKRL